MADIYENAILLKLRKERRDYIEQHPDETIAQLAARFNRSEAIIKADLVAIAKRNGTYKKGMKCTRR